MNIKHAVCSRKTWLALLGLLASLNLSPAFAADDSLSRLLKDGVVRVANTQTSPPWSYIDDQNQPTGYDVAVAKEIFKRVGVPNVVFVADKFSNFVESIKTGKYDVVVSSMAKTAERDKVVDFTTAYSVQAFRIWVHKANDSIHDVATLKDGKTVGATIGTTNAMWVERHIASDNVKLYENAGGLYSDLNNQRLDALIDSYFGGEKMQKSNKLDIKAVGEPVIYSLGAAVVPEGANALREAMDKAIKDMIADGTINTLGHQFLGKDYDVAGDMAKANQDW